MTEIRKMTKEDFVRLIKDRALAREVKRYLESRDTGFLQLCHKWLRKELASYVSLKLVGSSYKRRRAEIAEEIVSRFFAKWNEICDKYNPDKGNLYGYAVKCVMNELNSFFREEAKNVNAFSSNVSISPEALEQKIASQQDLFMNKERFDTQLDDMQVELIEDLQSMFVRWSVPKKLAFAVKASATHGDKGGGYEEIARSFRLKEGAVRSCASRAWDEVKNLVSNYKTERGLTLDQARDVLELFCGGVREYYMFLQGAYYAVRWGFWRGFS